MSSDADRIRRMLASHHAKDPCCRSCGMLTVIASDYGKQHGAKPLAHSATMTRPYPKGHRKFGARRVLLCWTCANALHQAWQDERPLHELWIASGRFGSVYSVTLPHPVKGA